MYMNTGLYLSHSLFPSLHPTTLSSLRYTQPLSLPLRYTQPLSLPFATPNQLLASRDNLLRFSNTVLRSTVQEFYGEDVGRARMLQVISWLQVP
jgi:hypothetical protein